MNSAGFCSDLTLSFQMSVEVERKFLCNAGILKTLEEIGGIVFNLLATLSHIGTFIF